MSFIPKILLKLVGGKRFSGENCMKVVMINDCAFVGETLLKYLPNELEKQHIKRTRKFLIKRFPTKKFFCE